MIYKELNLWQLLLILRKRFLFIILFVLLCGGSAFLTSKYLITPLYTANASLYVYSNTNMQGQITSFDLEASQELVNTYIVVLKSDTVLNQVIAKLGLVMTSNDLREMLTAGAIEGTEAFEIGITHSDPYTAQVIVNTIIDIAPKEIVRVVQAGGAEIIDYAKVSLNPSSPNIIINTVMCSLIGFIVAFVICIAVVAFDTKVRSEEDLSVRFTIPVIGSVPSLIKYT